MKTNLRVSDGSKSLLFQLINGLFVLSEVQLCTNQNDRDLWTMVPNLKWFIRIHQVIITEHVSGVRYSPLDTIWLSHSRSWLGSRGRNKSGTRPEERKTFMLSRFVHQPYRLRIGEGPQSVVILLSGCVPQTKVDRPAIHLLGRWVISFTRDLIVLIYHNIGRVVVEDGWNILSREGIGCVTDQQTSFTYSKYWSTH